MLSATFAGRIGRVGDLRYTQTGTAVLGFALAVDDGHGEKKTTLWIDCSLWGKRAEALQPYLSKGDAVTVQGKPGLRQYESKGEHRATLTCMINEITLQGGNRGEQRPSQARQPRAESPAAASFDDDFNDAIPF